MDIAFAKSRLLTHARLTSGWRNPAQDVVKDFCALVDADGVSRFETKLSFAFPLLHYISRAIGVDVPPMKRNDVYIKIKTGFVPDLEFARKKWAELMGEAVAIDMFPDWSANLHTDIEIQSAPLEHLHSAHYSSYDMHLAFSENHELLRARAYIAPPASMEGSIMNIDQRKVDLQVEIVEQMVRILNHQIRHQQKSIIL